MRLKRVSFGNTPIQIGKRITLNNNLLHNLEIQEGDLVELLLDVDEKAIIVKKVQSSAEQCKNSKRSDADI